MSTKHVSTLEQALSESEARYTETQKQIAQLVNGFHQLQQVLMQQQQKPPSPPIKKNPIYDSVPQVSTRQLRPALPDKFDGDHSNGMTFLWSCQTYILLCLESFSDDQVKIVWALSYMKSGQAAKWATHVFKWEEENAGDSRFLDWDNLKLEFHKEFCPANSEATAINKLESTTYYQRTQSVDDYLDEFLDLVVESGYTDPIGHEQQISWRNGSSSRAHHHSRHSSIIDWSYEKLDTLSSLFAMWRNSFKSSMTHSMVHSFFHLLPTNWWINTSSSPGTW